MKPITKTLMIALAVLFTGLVTRAQDTKTSNNHSNTSNTKQMKTYLIERDIPEAGKLTAQDLKGIAQKSCSVVKELGPDIVWVQSYVTGDKFVCVYKATSESLIREHAKKGGFPVNKITEVATIFSPATAN